MTEPETPPLVARTAWPVAGPGAPTQQWRARRWSVFAAPWLLYLGYPLATVWDQPRVVERVLGTLALVAFSAIYLFGVPRALIAERAAVRYRMLLGMLAIMLPLVVLIGPDGLATLIYVASAGTVLLPTRQAAPFAVALAAATALLPAAVPDWHRGPQWASGFSVLGAAFIGYGFMVLIRNNAALRAAREEVARLAAEQERLRIARDIHDLLGHSLTTITVKAELAGRLVYRDPDRAEGEMAEVEQLARQSLSDVRAAVAGYRAVSLAVELATAREVLAAAGIAAEVPRAVDQVPGELRELFGWAVREGVTNAVRHSRAHQVRISVQERAVEVVDDGPATPDPAAGGNGSGGGAGLAGLAERAARLGGWVHAGPLDGQGYRLRVEVPAGPLGTEVPAAAPLAR